MILQEFSQPARVTKGGEDIIELTRPSKIKIHTTGADAQTLLEETPPNGKKWRVLIRVEVIETDE